MPPSTFTPSCKPTSDANAAQIVGEWITLCRLNPHGDAPPVVRIAAKRFAKALFAATHRRPTQNMNLSKGLRLFAPSSAKNGCA